MNDFLPSIIYKNSNLIYQLIAIGGGIYTVFLFLKKCIKKTKTFSYFSLMSEIPQLLMDIKNDQKIMFLEFKLQGKIVSSILDTLEIAQFLCDAEGKCIKVNPKWVSLTGLTEDEAKGHNWLLSIHPDDREYIQKKWLEMLETDAPFEETFNYQNRITKVITKVKCTATDVLNDKNERIFILGLSRIL